MPGSAGSCVTSAKRAAAAPSPRERDELRMSDAGVFPPPAPGGNGESGLGCSVVREIAQQSLLDHPAALLPPPAMAHARNCPDCRKVIADLSRLDECLTGACRSERER